VTIDLSSEITLPLESKKVLQALLQLMKELLKHNFVAGMSMILIYVVLCYHTHITIQNICTVSSINYHASSLRRGSSHKQFLFNPFLVWGDCMKQVLTTWRMYCNYHFYHCRMATKFSTTDLNLPYVTINYRIIILNNFNSNNTCTFHIFCPFLY